MLDPKTAEQLLELKYNSEKQLKSVEDFICELVARKESQSLAWADIRDLVYQAYGVLRDESAYRKKYTALKRIQNIQTDIASNQKDIDQQALTLKKERVKLADERNQTKAYVRRLAREETLKEIALEAVEKIASAKPLLVSPKKVDKQQRGGNEGILMLSDWHYGIECENYWNTYNPEIARQRVSKLRDEAIAHCLKHDVSSLHVVNLADLIAGRIHLTLRLESRIDVITQTMEVSEILAELLVSLAQHFHIDYYSCTDNHSRLEPNKTDSLDLESLCRITDWYLKSRLKDYSNIIIHDNTFGEDIITFKCKKYSILGVHGDKDKPTQIIDSISRMTQDHFDLICTAHLHHFSCDEKNNTVVVCNGAVMGTDTYAKNLRLSSQPSQNLIIVSDKSVCEAIYRILLV